MTTLQQLKQKKLEEFEKKYDKPLREDIHKRLVKPNSVHTYYNWSDIKSFLSQAMDDIQNATIEAGQEEIGKMKKYGKDTGVSSSDYMNFQKHLMKQHIESFNSAITESHSALNNLKTK